MGLLKEESGLTATLNQDINYYTMMEKHWEDLVKQVHDAADKKFKDAILNYSRAAFVTRMILAYWLMQIAMMYIYPSLGNLAPSFPNRNYERAITKGFNLSGSKVEYHWGSANHSEDENADFRVKFFGEDGGPVTVNETLATGPLLKIAWSYCGEHAQLSIPDKNVSLNLKALRNGSVLLKQVLEEKCLIRKSQIIPMPNLSDASWCIWLAHQFTLFVFFLPISMNWGLSVTLSTFSDIVKNVSNCYMELNGTKRAMRQLLICEIVGFCGAVFMHALLAVHFILGVSLLADIRRLGPNRPIVHGDVFDDIDVTLRINAICHVMIFCVMVLYNCLASKRNRMWWPYNGGLLYRKKIHLLHPSRFDHCQEFCGRLLLARNVGDLRELERILYDELEPFTQKFTAMLNGTLPAPPFWNFSSLD